jgi:hypothetical protein
MQSVCLGVRLKLSSGSRVKLRAHDTDGWVPSPLGLLRSRRQQRTEGAAASGRGLPGEGCWGAGVLGCWGAGVVGADASSLGVRQSTGPLAEPKSLGAKVLPVACWVIQTEKRL